MKQPQVQEESDIGEGFLQRLGLDRDMVILCKDEHTLMYFFYHFFFLG
jgi:hypothetical protein